MKDEFLRLVIPCGPILGRPIWLAAAYDVAVTDKSVRVRHLACMCVRSRRKRQRECLD